MNTRCQNLVLDPSRGDQKGKTKLSSKRFHSEHQFLLCTKRFVERTIPSPATCPPETSGVVVEVKNIIGVNSAIKLAYRGSASMKHPQPPKTTQRRQIPTQRKRARRNSPAAFPLLLALPQRLPPPSRSPVSAL